MWPALPPPMDVPPSSMRAEANLAAALIAAQYAAGSAARTVVVDDSGEWTAGELEAATARAAGALRARGLGRGDRVAIGLRPGRAWLQAFLGTVQAGGIAVPVDPDGPVGPIGAFLEGVAPAALVTDRAAPAPVEPIHPAELDGGAPGPLVPVAADDCAFMIATSGSTGRPKGVMHAHGPSLRPGYVQTVLGVGPDDRVLSASAGFSALGLFIGILRPLAAGACVVLSARRPTARSIIAAVDRGHATVVSAVPTFWAQIAAFLERHPEHAAPIARLRHAVSSGEPLAPSVARRLRATTGTELLDGYGSAECGDIVIGHRPGEVADGLGRAAPGVELRLQPLTAYSGSPFTTGHLLVRCPTARLGYWGHPDATGALPSGWVRTGDVVRRSGRGFRLEGRVDGLLKVGGQWLRPTDAEACLYEHPAVIEAAVVGVRSRRDVQGAAVFVSVGVSPTEGLVGDLRRMLVQRVGSCIAGVPVTIVDQLPRLSSGKLDRGALLGMAA